MRLRAWRQPVGNKTTSGVGYRCQRNRLARANGTRLLRRSRRHAHATGDRRTAARTWYRGADIPGKSTAFNIILGFNTWDAKCTKEIESDLAGFSLGDKKEDFTDLSAPSPLDVFHPSVAHWLAAVGETSKKIASIHEEALSATTTEEETTLSKQLKPLIDNTNKRAKRTKTLLGLLKEETDKLKAQGTLNASDIRYVFLF